jgi:putative ABC transport system permease protein
MFFGKTDQKDIPKKNKVKAGKMRLSVIILLSFRNIVANRTRSILTIGGVAIGLGIITLLLSIGFGVQNMVINEITKNNPSNIIDVSSDNLENFILLDDATLDKIRNIKGVVRVENMVEVGGKIYNNNSQVDSVIFGITKDYMDMAKLNFKSGSLDFSDTDATMVVTPKLANLLGFDNPADAIGQEVEYDMVFSKDLMDQSTYDANPEMKKITIKGIMNDDANKNASVDAYMPMAYLKDNFGIKAGQSGKIEIKDETKIDSIRSQIEQLGLTTASVTDTVNAINSFFVIIRIIMIIFGSIIMSISAMGMLNTLSVSLLQRTREVGILKALGAKRKDVFKLFILEAAIISFSGGIIGLVGGYSLAKLINFIFNVLAARKGMEPTYFVQIPYYFILAITVFISILGFSTGIIPAMRASKTHALDALRYE